MIYIVVGSSSGTDVLPIYCLSARVKFALEQVMKSQRGSRGIVLLFL